MVPTVDASRVPAGLVLLLLVIVFIPDGIKINLCKRTCSRFVDDMNRTAPVRGDVKKLRS